MVLVQNKYKNTLVGVLRTQITFVTHSSPSCYVTLRTQVIRLNSGNLGPQKTDSGVFTIVYLCQISNCLLVCVEGRGRISRSGLTQDIKMVSCVFQCDVPHQWIAQRQVGPVSVYCDGVGCRVLCLRHGISVWQHIGQSTTATSRYRRDMTSDVSKRS